MTSVGEEFAEFTFHDLRAMAVFLQRKPSRRATKEELARALAAHWQRPAQLQQSLDRLSPAAQRALWWLCHAESVPAQLLWNEFGDVRRARDRQQGQPAPWQQPATAAEELFYSGLIHARRTVAPTAEPSIRTMADARQLMLPASLRRQLVGLVTAAQPLPQPDADRPPLLQMDNATPDALVHDLGQYLIYLHQIGVQQPQPLTLLHNRWLAPRHLRAVAARLARPQAGYALRSHKSNGWLRLLAFLATAAGLHAGGRLTAHGWAWLAHAPPDQLALLWQSWQQSAWKIRDAFAQPDGGLPTPWPSLLTEALAAAQSPFTPADLAAQLLSRDRVSAIYWTLYIETLQHSVDLLAALCASLLTPLGIIAPAAPPSPVAAHTQPSPAYYALTPLGKMLVQSGATAAPAIAASVAAGAATVEPAVRLTADETHAHITITFPAPSPISPAPVSLSPVSPSPVSLSPVSLSPVSQSPVSQSPVSPALHAQAVIAGFADYGGQAAGVHHYQITAATLARAAASDLGLPTLAAALQAVAIPLAPPLWQTLQAGYNQGRQLQLEPALLLRATDADQLAALHQAGPVAALFAEILTPTTALLGVDPATALTTLQQHGYFAQSPYAHAPQPNDRQTSPSATPAIQPSAATTPLDLQQPAREVLWLAGQLYALLADHLPLPMAPSAAPLQALFATLPAATQATLAAQRQIMAEQLRTLLDNLPFTPPLEPSDPAEWIPLIDAALDDGHRLQMRYFSAGRNLVTHRLVDPYWREEHRGIPYLRAYCHSAGQVLTFRLDRVEGLVCVKRNS